MRNFDLVFQIVFLLQRRMIRVCFDLYTLFLEKISMRMNRCIPIVFSWLPFLSAGCADSARPQTTKQALESSVSTLPDKAKPVDTSALRAFYQKRINEHQQEKKASARRRSLEDTQKARLDALRSAIKQKHTRIQETHASWKSRTAK